MSNFIECSKRRGWKEEGIKNSLSLWAIRCIGKTEEQLEEMGMGYTKEWLVTINNDNVDVTNLLTKDLESIKKYL